MKNQETISKEKEIAIEKKWEIYRTNFFQGQIFSRKPLKELLKGKDLTWFDYFERIVKRTALKTKEEKYGWILAYLGKLRKEKYLQNGKNNP